jgi:DNA-binding NtrC family response regulator
MKTLLVIEDDTSGMQLLRRMLAQFNVMEATTAEEALLLIVDHHVDLLVADVTLSGMSGIQIALLLRARIPDLPVILTSGHPVSNWGALDSAGLRKLGSNWQAIKKPLHADVLLNALCKLTGARHPGKYRTVSQPASPNAIPARGNSSWGSGR